jgi:tRNA/rRNA methyltransferase
MKVMGFSDLVLVAPRYDDVLDHPEAHAMASGATDVLARARIVPTLGDALDGITWACATAMTPRDFGPPTRAPRELFGELALGAHRVAFVFGSERFGMSNDDVYRCQVCVSIPTLPAYGSLNLAQAVQLLDVRLADDTAVQGLLDHWRRTLVGIDFLDPAVPRKLMPRLRQLLNRAQLSDEEVHILRGIARAIDKARR